MTDHSMYDYYVHILSSPDKVLSIGVTNDLRRRTNEHQQNIVPGFSRTNGCDRLVYYQHFGDIRCAIAREKQLKGWRRAKKIELVESNNPEWRELSTDL